MSRDSGDTFEDPPPARPVRKVRLLPGVHRLSAPLVLGTADSGASTAARVV